MKILFAVSLVLLASLGCTDAQRSQLGAYGGRQQVTLYSGGQAVRVWTSTGKVSTESQSDGYYFRDEKTQKLVRVSGDVVIERLD